MTPNERKDRFPGTRELRLFDKVLSSPTISRAKAESLKATVRQQLGDRAAFDPVVRGMLDASLGMIEAFVEDNDSPDMAAVEAALQGCMTAPEFSIADLLRQMAAPTDRDDDDASPGPKRSAN